MPYLKFVTVKITKIQIFYGQNAFLSLLHLELKLEKNNRDLETYNTANVRNKNSYELFLVHFFSSKIEMFNIYYWNDTLTKI